jgi:hypothetical protein
MEYSPDRTPKQESERLISMYCNWLNYDQTIDERWHDPSAENKKRHALIRKNALRLSIIFVNEILKITILDQKKFYKSVLKILKI